MITFGYDCHRITICVQQKKKVKGNSITEFTKGPTTNNNNKKKTSWALRKHSASVIRAKLKKTKVYHCCDSVLES